MPETAPDLQELTLRAYTVLYHLRKDWAGELILSCGLDPYGSALSLTSHIVGAACLTIEPDLSVARQALRSGVCDFLVTTLDEALRTLKTQIRQRAPLSVALHGDPTPLLNELLTRSLAPILFSDSTKSTPPEIAHNFSRQGSIFFDFECNTSYTIEAIDVSAFFVSILKQHDWHVEDFVQSSVVHLKNFDAQALTLIRHEDEFRLRWLNVAIKILPRQNPLHRTLLLAPEETRLMRNSMTTSS